MHRPADYPEPVRECLFATLFDVIQPLCIELDAQGRIMTWVGAPDRYSLRLVPEQAALIAMPWLAGLPLDRATYLPQVCIDRQHICDINLVPRSEPQRVYLIISTTQGALTSAEENQHNTDKVGILTYQLATVQEQLKAAKVDATAASELKSLFIAGMSHEFRSPLTSILGYCELLEKQLEPSDRRLQGIRRSSNHLLSLVENLLEHGRVVADKIEPLEENVSLPRLFESLNLMFEPLATQKNLQLKIEQRHCESAEIITDPVRVRQVLVNLISNAIRYTEEGWVKVIWKQEKDELQVVVADSGPGIPAAQRETIFQAFAQLESQSEGKKKGLGLGLSISRHLAEVLGGRISLESTLGKGSKFLLRIRAPAAQPTEAASVEEAALSGQGHILVVEDDMDVREFLAVVLRDWGFVPLMANDAREALSKASAAAVDLMLTDMKLPDQTGQALIRDVRSQHPRLPIIAMSASNAEEERGEAFAAGCSAFLVKPFELEVLLRELTKYVSVHS